MQSQYGMRGADGIALYLGEQPRVSVIIFDEQAFLFKPLHEESIVGGLPFTDRVVNFSKIEVIGNIHDTPELLEAKE